MAPSMSTFTGFETYQELLDQITAGLGGLTPDLVLPGWRDRVTNEPLIVQLNYTAAVVEGGQVGKQFFITLVRDYVQGRPTTGRWTYGGAALNLGSLAQRDSKMNLTCVDANDQTIDGHFRRFMPGQWQ